SPSRIRSFGTEHEGDVGGLTIQKSVTQSAKLLKYIRNGTKPAQSTPRGLAGHTTLLRSAAAVRQTPYPLMKTGRPPSLPRRQGSRRGFFLHRRKTVAFSTW